MSHTQRYPFAPKAVWWKRLDDKAGVGTRTIYVATDTLGFEIVNYRNFKSVPLINGKLARENGLPTNYVAITKKANLSELEPGLYDENWNFISWDSLKEQGLLNIEGGVLKKVNTNLKGFMVVSDEITSLGETADNVASRAFSYCRYLTGIVLSKNITSSRKYMFSECERLSYLYLNDKLWNLDAGSFYDCKKLESIFIPKALSDMNVMSVSGYLGPFNGASTKLKMYCEAESKPYGWDTGWDYFSSSQRYNQSQIKYGCTREEYEKAENIQTTTFLPSVAIRLAGKIFQYAASSQTMEEQDIMDEGLSVIDATPNDIMIIEKNTYLRKYAFDCIKETDQQDSSYQPIKGLFTDSSYLTLKTHNFCRNKDMPKHEDILYYQDRFWMVEDTTKTYIYTPKEKLVLHLSLKAIK